MSDLLEGLIGQQESYKAPTMGRLKKIHYSHDSMIDTLIANPVISQNQLAAMFDRTPAWVSNLMASDVFQARLAERREELVDPTIRASLEERARALFEKAQEVLLRKLHEPTVSEKVALKAYELGAKSVGVGGNAPPRAAVVDLDLLAHRLRALKRGGEPQAIEGEARVVSG